MLPAILWQKKLQKNDILPAAGDKESPLNPQKRSPLGPPKGGRESLGLIGLMGLMGLIRLISLIVEPYGSPKGGGEYL